VAAAAASAQQETTANLPHPLRTKNNDSS